MNSSSIFIAKPIVSFLLLQVGVMNFHQISHEFPMGFLQFPGSLPFPWRHLRTSVDLGRLSGRGHGPHVAQGGAKGGGFPKKNSAGDLLKTNYREVITI